MQLCKSLIPLSLVYQDLAGADRCNSSCAALDLGQKLTAFPEVRVDCGDSGWAMSVAL